MTDQIPADKVREVRDLHRDAAKMATITDAEREIHQHVADAMEALLLTPPTLPTLADMSMEERAACQWMQADVENRSERYVIATPHDAEGDATLLDSDGGVEWFSPERVTPRPDLPRMEWPGTEKPAPTPALPEGWRLADHKGYGRGIVTNPAPNRDGHVYFVIPDDDPMGYEWVFCTPDDLTYLDTDQETDTTSAVPPNTLAVGSVWDDAVTLVLACKKSRRGQIVIADSNGDVSVWNVRGDWLGECPPHPGCAPYTILHTGKGPASE